MTSALLDGLDFRGPADLAVVEPEFEGVFDLVSQRVEGEDRHVSAVFGIGNGLEGGRGVAVAVTELSLKFVHPVFRWPHRDCGEARFEFGWFPVCGQADDGLFLRVCTAG